MRGAWGDELIIKTSMRGKTKGKTCCKSFLFSRVNAMLLSVGREGDMKNGENST